MTEILAPSPHKSATANAQNVRQNAGFDIRCLGTVPYEPTWRAMQKFTAERGPATVDELWILQHPPIYTLGLACRAEHLPRTDNGIPMLKIDRGGQITYHGPGQLIVYLLLDMQRLGLGVRALVRQMELAVVDLLAEFGINATGKPNAPGVYVNSAKIAALGLRIKRGCCYHGLALNVDMDLTPFHIIDPCGYKGLAVTQMRDLGINEPMDILANSLCEYLVDRLISVSKH